MDTLLKAGDALPLTCSRAGTCCHGKAIFLNPWEISCLARAKGCTPKEFRERHTAGGGVRMRMGAPPRETCGQYEPSRGCAVYEGRPLACRLFPLGRQVRHQEASYLHRGADFPCLAECPEVRGLPQLTVREFLDGQGVAAGEAAHDSYLEVALELAEGALVVLLDEGLVARGDRATLGRWRALGAMGDDERAASLPADWLDLLTAPGLEARPHDAVAFVADHFELIQAFLAEQPFPGALPELLERCCRMMAASLHLGRSVGLDPREAAARWVDVGRQNGAPG